MKGKLLGRGFGPTHHSPRPLRLMGLFPGAAIHVEGDQGEWGGKVPSRHPGEGPVRSTRLTSPQARAG